MKHPREILLERHRSADPRLDSVRKNVLAHLTTTSRRGTPRNQVPCNARSSLRELLLSFRWHLAGLSAAWLVVLLLNMEPSPTEERSLAKHNASPPRQLLTALLENRRQVAQLLGSGANTSEAAPEPPAFVPKRRGEIQSTNSMA